MAKVDRKKLLKEPDEFLSFSDQAFRWGKANIKLLVVVTTVLVVALGAVLGIQTYLNHRAAQANDALAQVFADYTAVITGQADQAQTEAATQGLQKMMEQYGATSSGMQARLALGELWLHRGQPDKAEKVLTALCDEPDLPPLLAPLAHTALGRCQEMRQKYAEAAEAYANAIKVAGPAQAALLRLDRARALEAAGDKSQAENLYRALQDSKDPSLAQAARQRLMAMGLEPAAAPEPAMDEPTPQAPDK